MQDALIRLLAGRQGHFRLESGHHGDRWFELDPLFVRPSTLRPFVVELAARLARHQPAVICGPLVGGAFLAQLIAAELDVAFAYAERHAPPPGDALYTVEYRLPPALRGLVRDQPVAIVDDAISAGSAVRGTLADLRTCGARPVALGALIVFGEAIVPYAAIQGLPLEHLVQLAIGLWAPPDCPLCAAGVPLQEVTSAL
jgi:orotate phosphoribosyltransferase